MKRAAPFGLVVAFSVAGLAGCSSPQPQVVNNAPPVAAAPIASAPAAQPPVQGVYNWREVPAGERVPISRGVFDQGGYQLFSPQGTIIVPFENENLYVMKFGRTSGGMYFVNEGGVPVLYLPPGGFLENAAAQGARWYPIPNDYNYVRPMYVAVAPSWAEYRAMGWYPGMAYYGGMWGYSPVSVAWMPGFHISIGGSRYADYTVYRTYYTRNAVNRVGWDRSPRFNYAQSSTGSWNRMRNSMGGAGSFGAGRNNSAVRSVSGFGSAGRSSAFGSNGSFGSRQPATTSRFGSSSTFGSRPPRATSSFGSDNNNSNSFGSRRSSFGGTSSGFSNTGRSSSSSFGGTRSSFGGSFGGGRTGSSFGGSSSGGSRSSFGSSSFSGGRSSFGGSSRRR
jgi:hypothetical protein